LGLIAQQEGKTVVLADQAVEAIAQQVIEVLGLADFDIRCEFLVHGEAGLSVGVERFAEAVGEEAGFEAGGAEDGLLSESDALKGE
jgi:Holliday junction resolvasome RuvABC ATP-dependent DNA helicase subunit